MSEEAPVTDSSPVETDWRSSLPDDLRENPSLQDVGDIATLAKRFVDTKAMVGSSIRPPTSDAGQEDIDAFMSKLEQLDYLPIMRKPDPENAETMTEIYKRLGRPEDASGYERPEGVDPEAFGAMTSKALELGLSNKQLSELAKAQLEMQNAQIEQMTEQRNAGVAQLRGEWGQGFEERVSRGIQVVKALGGHEQLEAALESGNADAATLRFVNTVAEQLGKEGTQIAQQIQQVNTETTSELKERRADITNRLLNENLTPSQQKELQQRLVKLSEQILAAG